MKNQSATANDDKELIEIEIDGAVCKVLSKNKEEQDKCQLLKESAFVGEIDKDKLKNYTSILKSYLYDK